MKLFLDTSVLVAASGSSKGASRFIIESAPGQQWILLTAPYCVEETVRNVPKLGRTAAMAWRKTIHPALVLVPNELALDKALVFPKAKDRHVLISALGAEADVLLTLDEGDFQNVIGSQVYGMAVRTPGQFLLEQRKAGLL